MKKVLLIEDNRTVAKLASLKINEELDLTVDIVSSYGQAKTVLENNGKDYFIVVTGLVLPDATNGEAVDYCLENNFPVIVLTSSFDDETRERILSKDVFDYIVEKDQDYINFLIFAVKRAYGNRKKKVLVVDDSQTYRKYLVNFISSQLFKVFEADSGEVALKILEQNPDISLLITDFDMPGMDGFELLRKVRKTKKSDELVVIVVSGENDTAVIPHFLKFGANDYLKKPFNKEEFISRINMNVDYTEIINDLKNIAHIDITTGLYNKKYIMEIGKVVHSNSLRNKIGMDFALVEIDNFDKLYDSLDERGVNKLIKDLAKIFDNRLRRRSDVLARVSFNSIGILTDNDDEDDAYSFYDKIRLAVEKNEFQYMGKTCRLTVSIGITTRLFDSFDNMVVQTIKVLDEAKSRGGNIVWLD
jgi:diguanylate cyclase (GGDEF)-like protein